MSKTLIGKGFTAALAVMAPLSLCACTGTALYPSVVQPSRGTVDIPVRPASNNAPRASTLILGLN